MEWNGISVVDPIKIYIVVLQNGGETHRISGRIYCAFPRGVVFIYTGISKRPGVFGCIRSGGRGVTVGGIYKRVIVERFATKRIFSRYYITQSINPSIMNISFNITKYAGVMAFYAVLTYLLFPAIAYFFFGKTLEAAGNGFIVGNAASVILWKVYGYGLVKGA